VLTDSNETVSIMRSFTRQGLILTDNCFIYQKCFICKNSVCKCLETIPHFQLPIQQAVLRVVSYLIGQFKIKLQTANHRPHIYKTRSGKWQCDEGSAK